MQNESLKLHYSQKLVSELSSDVSQKHLSAGFHRKIKNRLKRKTKSGKRLSPVERHLLRSTGRIKKRLFGPSPILTFIEVISVFLKPLPIVLVLALIVATESNSSAGWLTSSESSNAQYFSAKKQQKPKTLSNDAFELSLALAKDYSSPKEPIKKTQKKDSGLISKTLEAIKLTKPAEIKQKEKHLGMVEFISGLIAVYYPKEKNPGAIAKDIVEISLEEKIDPIFVSSLIAVESSFRRNARSRMGAKGLMQLMPRTAKVVAGRTGIPAKNLKLGDPRINIKLGINYFQQLEKAYNGNRFKALAAYNWGPGNVEKADRKRQVYPKPVKNYAMKILSTSSSWNGLFKTASDNAAKLKSPA